MSDVNIRMSVEDAEAAAAWSRFNRDMRIASEKVAEIERRTVETAKAGRVMNSEFGAAAVSIGKAALNMAGLGSPLQIALSVTRLLRQEWDGILERQKSVADKQIDVNAAWRNASQQLTGRETTLTPESLMLRVISDRRRRGVDPKEVFNTFREVAGSAGNVPLEDVLETTMLSTNLFPQWSQEDRSSVVRGSMLVGKAFGKKPSDAFAGVAQGMAIDPTMTAAQYGQFVLPTVASLRNMGNNKDSFEYLLALTSAFGQRSGDITGRSSGTNIQNVIRQVQRDAAGAGLIDPGKSGIEDVVRAVSGNPVLQEKLLGVFAQTELGTSAPVLVKSMEEDLKNRRELSVEARKFVAAKELLQFGKPDNILRREFDAAKKDLLGLTPAAMEETRRQESLLTKSQFGSAAEVERESKQNQSQFEILQTQLGTRGAARASLTASLNRMGIGALGQTIIGTQFEIQDRLSGGGEEATKGLLRQYERAYAQRVLAGEPFAADKSGAAAARDILSAQQGDQIIELLKEGNAQRGNVQQAEKAATLNLIPKKVHVGKAMADKR